MRFSLVSNYQPTKVVQPGEGPFDYPPMAVVGHLSFPARPRPFATSFRDARLDSPPPQPVSECSRIVASVGYQFPGTTAGSSPGPRYPHRCQGSLGQSDLRPLGAGHQGSQGGPLVVYHQHKFGALALAGQSYLVSPFLAGAKVASRWARSHSSLPWASRVPSRVRQISSQTPCSCHWFSRRQQVTELPYSPGRSCQRQPVRNTYKTPLMVRRSSALGRPLRLGAGNQGCISFHWASLNSCSTVPPHTFPLVRSIYLIRYF